ncbi:hypothetical protein OOK31_27150 [Streptomyces sp. NBC_00249]|uniref:hypothetical protein n=1 Tax=Streptomyces sp. NBC_00249 TaxID=2975690 RepID=UPI002254BAC5|nr:hypothetical protein [Streptomyces sp. NBC_00249]MCX5197530.1 hypothetical protein [Streptomyces sp. NBC_00249]
MHPTRTSTKLLLNVACAVSAVSAVSGCVSVAPAPVGPASAPAAGAVPRHEPRGGPGAAPVVVQAPALEALRAVPREAAARAAAPAAVSRRATTHTTGQAPAGPQEAVPPVPDIPEPRRFAERPAGRGEDPAQRVRPDARVPREVVRELPVRPADVCALGRRHGRWHPDSPEARICAGVQGG